jgi:hypothetical protein
MRSIKRLSAKVLNAKTRSLIHGSGTILFSCACVLCFNLYLSVVNPASERVAILTQITCSKQLVEQNANYILVLTSDNLQ